MCGREQIKKVILKNGKLIHWCVQKKWYEKNQLMNEYGAIFEETKFLDSEASFRERLFYIERDIYEPVFCPICGKPRRLKLGGVLKFFKTCLSEECVSKASSEALKKAWSGKSNKEKEIRAKKISFKAAGRKLNLTPEQRKKISERQIGTKQSQETIKKRLDTRRKNGTFTPSAETRLKLSESNKKTHLSPEFREKYKEIYKAAHAKISVAMKKKILSGEFTPPITNSWTKWTAYAMRNGEKKKFRSSWEAVFWLMNPDLLYEKIRIPYRFNGLDKIYIVDFVAPRQKIVYEIKPKSVIDTKKNKEKFKALENWCNKNGFTWEIIDDDWFRGNVTTQLLNENEHLLKPMKQFL